MLPAVLADRAARGRRRRAPPPCPSARARRDRLGGRVALSRHDRAARRPSSSASGSRGSSTSASCVRSSRSRSSRPAEAAASSGRRGCCPARRSRGAAASCPALAAHLALQRPVRTRALNTADRSPAGGRQSLQAVCPRAGSTPDRTPHGRRRRPAAHLGERRLEPADRGLRRAAGRDEPALPAVGASARHGRGTESGGQPVEWPRRDTRRLRCTRPARRRDAQEAVGRVRLIAELGQPDPDRALERLPRFGHETANRRHRDRLAVIAAPAPW